MFRTYFNLNRVHQTWCLAFLAHEGTFDKINLKLKLDVCGSGKPARNQQIKSITSDCRQLRRFCVVSYDAFLASYPNQGPYFVRSSLRNAGCRTFEINLSIHEKPVDPIKENWLIRCTFVGTRENCTFLVIGSWEKERVCVSVRERENVRDWEKEYVC